MSISDRGQRDEQAVPSQRACEVVTVAAFGLFGWCRVASLQDQLSSPPFYFATRSRRRPQRDGICGSSHARSWLHRATHSAV